MNIDLSVCRKGKKEIVKYYPRVVLRNTRFYAPPFSLPNVLTPSTLKNRFFRYKKEFNRCLKSKGLDDKEINNLWGLFCTKIQKGEKKINLKTALSLSKIYKNRWFSSHRPEILRNSRRPGKINKNDKPSRILCAQLKPALKIMSDLGTGFIKLPKINKT